MERQIPFASSLIKDVDSIRLWNKLDSSASIIGSNPRFIGNVKFVDAKFQKGSLIDEVNSVVVFPLPYLYRSNYPQGSIEFWIKFNYSIVNGIPSDGKTHYLLQSIDNDGNELSLYLDNSGLNFKLQNFILTANPTIDANTFVYLTIGWSVILNKMEIFLDGSSIATLNNSTIAKISDIYLGNSKDWQNPANAVFDNFIWYGFYRSEQPDKDVRERFHLYSTYEVSELDLSKYLDDGIELLGTPVILYRSIVERDAMREMYGMTSDARVTIDWENGEQIKCFIAFPLGISRTRNMINFYVWELMPIKGFFKKSDNVKIGDVLKYTFDDGYSFHLEIVDRRDYGYLKSVTSMYILALYKQEVK